MANGELGSVLVTVTDQAGEPIPGALATLTSSEVDINLISDAEGKIRFRGLPPGKYELTVMLTGFNTYVNHDIPVGAGQTVPVQVVLTLAQIQE